MAVVPTGRKESEWANNDLILKTSLPSENRSSDFETVDSEHHGGPIFRKRKSRELNDDSDRVAIKHFASLHREEILIDLELKGFGVIGSLKPHFDIREWVGSDSVGYSGASRKSTVQVRRVLAERLYSIEELASAEEWSHVFFDTVKAHNCVYEKTRVLHRDVNLKNIMFRRKGEDAYGVLTDYDMASSFDDPGTHSPAGTLPFMALEFHEYPSNPPLHLYRHDLESFFYVFLFVVCPCDFVVKGERQTLRKNNEKGIAGWLQLNNEQLLTQKSLLFLKEDKFLQIIDKIDRHHSFKALKPCLVVLYDAFYEGFHKRNKASSNETLFGLVTYDLFEKAKAAATF